MDYVYKYNKYIIRYLLLLMSDYIKGISHEVEKEKEKGEIEIEVNEEADEDEEDIIITDRVSDNESNKTNKTIESIDFSQDKDKTKSKFKSNQRKTIKYDDILIDSIKENRIKEIIGYLKVQKQSLDENDINTIFDRLDDDNDNKISVKELKFFLLSLKSSINNVYIDQIFNEFDMNKDGFITKEQFYSKMNQQTDKGNENDLSELLEIFKLFDSNHDDKVCSLDLMNVFKVLGENFSEEQCKEMMRLLCGNSEFGHDERHQFEMDFLGFFDLVKNEGRGV